MLELKEELAKKEEAFKGISHKTIQRNLKEKLPISYKRVKRTNKKVNSEFIKQTRFISAMLLAVLQAEGKFIVYVDETSINGQAGVEKSWGIKGNKYSNDNKDHPKCFT